MGVKDTLKKIPGVAALGRFVKYCVPESKAALDLMRQRKRRFDGKIRVGFLCQYIPAWDKLEPVYRLMLADDRFEPVLLCVPSGVENNRLTDPDSLENDTYNYFVKQGYPAVNTLTGKEQWLDLQPLNLQYIFCVRPYNRLKPVPYTSHALCRHSRLCLLTYGMPCAREGWEIMTNRDFSSRLYLHFTESEAFCRLRRQQHPLKHRLGLQKTVCVGLPAGQSILASREKVSPSWDFSKSDFRVMWTPRWTTDPKVGGTNFFTYRDAILDYAENHPDTDILLRPHPLMFNNFVKTGEMTQGEVDDYKARCSALSNVAFDTVSRYDATVWGSSVLVSDISGMIPEYLITGKPVIYCNTNMDMEMLEPMKKLLDACYTVKNRQELEACLEALRRGEDPLAQARRDAVESVFGKDMDVAGKIIKTLLADSKQ